MSQVLEGLDRETVVQLILVHSPPPPPPPSYSVEKRRDHRNCVGGRQISVIPPLLNTIIQVGGGGFTGGKMSIHTITAKVFSNPHTEFGAHRSSRLVTN